jgi:hypothetical protein
MSHQSIINQFTRSNVLSIDPNEELCLYDEMIRDMARVGSPEPLNEK